ncbi:MAG: aminotransferase class V-fold PLP-dependent enzyme [Pseudomonadota bacterium]
MNSFQPSLLAIPGPSVMPERVLRAMHRASPNIYEGELHEITDSLVPDLKTVAQTRHNVAMYICNGHGTWEAALANTINPGDTVLVLETGRFGKGWGELARTMGIETQSIDFGDANDVDINQLEAVLRADSQGKIKAVLSVQTDTSTSVKSDIPSMRKALDAAGHDALLMVDCIACLGCDEFLMDAWGVDVMVAASQKGLMTPPGMGFVWFNEKAHTVRSSVSPSLYWDWSRRIDPEVYYQYFAGTAPTHHIYGLREALNMLVHEEGLEAAWARHARIANAIWAAVDAWGPDTVSHNVEDRAKRSTAVSALKTAPDLATKMRDWCEREAGLVLGIGLGFDDFDSRFRIGHMGHQHHPMTLGVLGTIDCAFKALGAPHGAGAVEAASAVLAAGGSGTPDNITLGESAKTECC